MKFEISLEDCIENNFYPLKHVRIIKGMILKG